MHRKGNEKYFHYLAAGFAVGLIGLGVLGQPHHDDARKLILFPNQIKDVNDCTVIRFLRFQLHLPLRRKTIHDSTYTRNNRIHTIPYGMVRLNLWSSDRLRVLLLWQLQLPIFKQNYRLLFFYPILQI